MKKLLLILIVASMFLLQSCGLTNKCVIVKESGEQIEIMLDNFKGKEKIKIQHTNSAECSLYYKTDITEGSITVSYNEGILSNTHQLFTAATGADANSGVYIDSSTKTVTIIIEASESACGKIVFAFSSTSSPFK